MPDHSKEPSRNPDIQVQGTHDDLPYVGDTLSGPTIYIDGMQGLLNINGQIKIGLYQVVQDPAKNAGYPIVRTAVGRLAMDQQTLLAIYAWLGDIVGNIAKPESERDGSE